MINFSGEADYEPGDHQPLPQFFQDPVEKSREHMVAFDPASILKHITSVQETARQSFLTGSLVLCSYGENPETGGQLKPLVWHFSLAGKDIPEKVVETIEMNRDPHRNFYMGLQVMPPDLSLKSRGGIKDIVSVLGFVADFDDDKACDYKNRIPQGMAPSYVIETSKGRFQVGFLLGIPLENLEQAREIAARLKAHCRCDHGTADIAHVWRISGTLNWPNAKKVRDGRSIDPQASRLISFSDTRYRVADLFTLIPPVPVSQPVPTYRPVEFSQLCPPGSGGDDMELLLTSFKWPKGGKVEALFSGSHDGDHSGADQALCNHLAFLFQGDSGRMDTMFRQSRLMRTKWDEKHHGDGRTYGQGTIEEAIAGTITYYRPTNYNPTKEGGVQDNIEDKWEKPVPLKSDRVPDIDPNILPGVIGDMAKAVSVETETPLELSVGLILSVLATACQRKISIQIKQGYREPLNIWTVTVLGPANRKSSVLSKITKPLNLWESRKLSELEPDIKNASIKLKNQEARLKFLRGKYGSAGKDALEEIEAEILDIENNLVQVPIPPKLWAQDVTPEHLGTLLHTNDEKMSLISAEGGIFDIIGGRYSGGVANLDVFLQGHAGDYVRVDRGSREPVSLNSPALTLGLSPQPEVLRGLADKPGFRGKGLLARFIYLLPQSKLGYRGLNSDPVPENIAGNYQNLIFQLLDIEPDENEHGEIQPYVLKLSSQAYQAWADFYMAVEKDLREGGRFEHIKDWAGKLPGAAVRIAGLLHCAKNPHQPWVLKVDDETMGSALDLAATFSDNAFIAFDLMGADASFEGARKVWRWVERNRFESFTRRDCFNALQGTFQKVAKLEEPLNVLVEHHYVQASTKKTGGRPSLGYRVNPEFLEGWA